MYHHWGSKSIYWPLSPFRSLKITPSVYSKLLGGKFGYCYFIQSNHDDLIINPKNNEWLNEFINSIGKFYLQFIVPPLPAF